MKEAESVFNTFDIVSDVSNHHFLLPDDRDSSFSNAKSSVYTYIMKEWKILEEHLPDSIYVRVYESRIDLMRAVIVGVAGTPYHDGLFFFDIKLPSEYPNNPPILYFHSFGLGLNPNLYNSGKVCLSLLNTWPGEKWDPQRSTLFQVLLSIQALVLNEKPYFNEPWQIHVNKTFREAWSREYKETVFSLTWQLGNHLIRRPPKNYETFIRNHFCIQATTVLAACREYASGRVMVGYYCNNDLSPSLSCSKEKVSRSSWKMLKEDLYPKLVQMFQSLGSFQEPEKLELEEDEQGNNGDNENKGGGKIIMVASPKDKKKAGIFKKAVARIKGVVIRWKNKNSSGNNKISS